MEPTKRVPRGGDEEANLLVGRQPDNLPDIPESEIAGQALHQIREAWKTFAEGYKRNMADPTQTEESRQVNARRVGDQHLSKATAHSAGVVERLRQRETDLEREIESAMQPNAADPLASARAQDAWRALREAPDTNTAASMIRQAAEADPEWARLALVGGPAATGIDGKVFASLRREIASKLAPEPHTHREKVKEIRELLDSAGDRALRWHRDAFGGDNEHRRLDEIERKARAAREYNG